MSLAQTMIRSPWLRPVLILVALVSLGLTAWFGMANCGSGGGCPYADKQAKQNSAPEVRSNPQNPETHRDLMGLDAGSLGAVGSGGLVEVLVNLEDDRDDAEAALEAKFGFDLKLNSAHADDDNLFITKVPGSMAAALVADLGDDDGVEYAEINAQMSAFEMTTKDADAGRYEPNDPLYMFQWHFDQVNAEDAWPLSTGAGVVVAVIDTGVAYKDDNRPRKRGIMMPDLEETGMVSGYDFVDDDDAPYDLHGHGTHVAGTVAQSTNNDYGVAGLAFDADIMPLRVLDGDGRGSFSDVADAIRYAADHGADVINMSLGGFFPSSEVNSAVQYASKKGVVVVAAAGNSGSNTKSYPAAFDNVIAVAATQYDRKPTFYSNFGSYVDIAAPGGNTLVDQNNDGRPDGVMQETLKRGQDGRVSYEPTFALYMGTSMAAPHVAAGAALLVSQGVTNPAEVERILVESAQRDKNWDDDYGSGIMDVAAATQRHTTESGLWRVIAGGLLAAASLLTLRRKKQLELGDNPAKSVGFWAGWMVGAGALFVVPLWAKIGGVLGGMTARPLVEWGGLVWGGAWSPVMASALPVLGVAALALGGKMGRHIAAGFGLATAAVLGVAAWRATADITWLPGIAGGLDRAWLLANALVCAWIGHTALRRS